MKRNVKSHGGFATLPMRFDCGHRQLTIRSGDARFTGMESNIVT